MDCFASLAMTNPHDLPHRHPDRTDRDPDVVAAVGAHGRDRKNPGVPARRHDFRDRRAVAFASFLFRPSAFAALKQPLTAWVVGVGGLFGYHALYFLALRFAPPPKPGC